MTEVKPAIEWWYKDTKKGRLFVEVRNTGKGVGEMADPDAELRFHPHSREATAAEIIQHYSTMEKARQVLTSHGWHRDETVVAE